MQMFDIATLIQVCHFDIKQLKFMTVGCDNSGLTFHFGKRHMPGALELTAVCL